MKAALQTVKKPEMNKQQNAHLSEVVEAIKKAQSIAVISHYNPDADAYGSSCGFYLALKASGKSVTCCNSSGYSERYTFIPAASEIHKDLKSAELALICDCGSLERTGDDYKLLLEKFPLIVNIDHHVSNDYFGHLNYVLPDASSTSEIVYKIIRELQIKLQPEVATALFAGISGDTGSFRYASASPGTFRIAAELLEAGADLHLISSRFWGSRSLAAVKLQAEVMRQMKLHAAGRVCEVVATQEIYDATGSTPEDTEDLVERARDIEGVLVSIMIKWDKDQWKVSMRSKDKRYNVSDLAASFGGGGHVSAAAFRWRRSLDELRAQVIPKLEGLFA